MTNRAIRVLAGSLICGVVGAALPLIKLVTLRARSKLLHRDVKRCQQDAEKYKRDLQHARQLMRTLETELEEHKTQKNEDEETINNLRNESKDLRQSLTTVEHKLELSIANENQQQKTIAELLRRRQKPNSGALNEGQSADEEHVPLHKDTLNPDQEVCADGSKTGLEEAYSQNQIIVATESGSTGNPEDSHQSEPVLRKIGSLEESISMRIISGETLDPEIYLKQMRMKTSRRRRRTHAKEGAKAARRKNSSTEPPSESAAHGDAIFGSTLHTRRNIACNKKRRSLRERLDSELQEYFAKETVHRRSW